MLAATHLEAYCSKMRENSPSINPGSNPGSSPSQPRASPLLPRAASLHLARGPESREPNGAQQGNLTLTKVRQ